MSNSLKTSMFRYYYECASEYDEKLKLRLNDGSEFDIYE